MKRLVIHADRMLTDEGWNANCTVVIENGRVKTVKNNDTDFDKENADVCVSMLTPGLIDVHIHGGDGFDLMNPTEQGLEEWLDSLAQAGVSGILATPYTASIEEMRSSMKVISNVIKKQQRGEIGGARILGIHLEGPFISKRRLGAMNENYVLPPDNSLLSTLVEGYENEIVLMSLAPEEDGADRLIKKLGTLNIHCQIGHSDASYEQAQMAFSNGVRGSCHLFNAARGIHHREPGWVGYVLIKEDMFCEVIADLVHLHPATLQLIRKCKDPRHILLISDAVSTTHLPDGKYYDNGNVINVTGGRSFTENGDLNGGGSYVSESIRNLVSVGFTEQEAFSAATYNVDRWLKMDVCSNQEKKAFLTGWNSDLYPEIVIIGSQITYCNKRKSL